MRTITTDHTPTQEKEQPNRDTDDTSAPSDPLGLRLALRLSRSGHVTAVYPRATRVVCDEECGCPFPCANGERCICGWQCGCGEPSCTVGGPCDIGGPLGEHEVADPPPWVDVPPGYSATRDADRLCEMWRAVPDAIPAVVHLDSEGAHFFTFDDPGKLLAGMEETERVRRALENLDPAAREATEEKALKLYGAMTKPTTPESRERFLGQLDEVQQRVALDALCGPLTDEQVKRRALARDRGRAYVRKMKSEMEAILAPYQHSPEERLRMSQLPPAKVGLLPSPDEFRQGATARYTDLWNAKRMVELCGGDFRFCPEVGWLTWTGTHWQSHLGKDAPAPVMRMAKDTVRQLYRDANEMKPPTLPSNLDQLTDDQRKELKAEALAAAKEQGRARVHAIDSHSGHAITAMVKLARSEPFVVVQASDLDADPYLLNCPNGSVDLRTGKLHDHEPRELLTNIAGAPFDSNARCPVWERFLHDLTGGNRDLADYIQKSAGYSLSGDASEDIFLLFIGPPNAGKTTYLEAVRAAAGSYGITASSETFTARRGDGRAASPDVARLAGKRIVITSETEKTAKLAEAFVKLVTGGDTITARHLYREPFEFKPSFTIWLASNHDLRVSDDDEALWRRLVRVPCAHPAARPDKRLKVTLTSSETSRAAILAWAVKGFRLYVEHGLKTPEVVEQSVAQYRLDMDPLSLFLKQRCVFAAAHFTPTGELYPAYLAHHREEGDDEAPLSRKAFGKRLAARPELTSGKKGGERGWRGIGLLRTGE